MKIVKCHFNIRSCLDSSSSRTILNDSKIAEKITMSKGNVVMVLTLKSHHFSNI